MKWRDIICFQWHALWNGRFPPALIILFLPLLYAFLFGTIYSRNVVNNLAFTPGIVVFIRKRKLLNAAGVGHREVFQRLLGAVLPFEAIALCSFCLSLGVCIIVYGLPMRGSLWDCLFLMTCFLFFLLCVLTFFGSGAASVVEAMQDPMIYIMPGVLFSGLSWPTFCMNDIGGPSPCFCP